MDLKKLKIWLAGVAVLCVQTTYASIPVTPPSQGGETDIIRAFTAYSADVGQLASYLITAIAFLVFILNLKHAFEESRRTGEWGALGKTFVIGLAVVAVISFMANIAIGILTGM